MNRRGTCCFLMLSLVLAAAPSVQAESLEDVKKAITSKYKAYKTLQFKMKMTNNMEMSGMSMKLDADMAVEYERKDEKTVLSRTETKSKNIQKMGENEVKTESTTLSVSDGKIIWMMMDNAGEKTVTKSKVDPNQQDVFDHDKLFKQMEEMYSLKLLPDETIDGKPCHVIEMTPKQEMMKQMTSKMVQYYDKKTGIGMKTLTYDPKGKVTGTTITTDVKIDEKISPDRFTYTPPAGVQVIDQTKE